MIYSEINNNALTCISKITCNFSFYFCKGKFSNIVFKSHLIKKHRHLLSDDDDDDVHVIEDVD